MQHPYRLPPPAPPRNPADGTDAALCCFSCHEKRGHSSDCTGIFDRDWGPREDPKAIDVPVLMIHSTDDRIVPIHDSALKTYKGLPHGLCATNPETVIPDLLALLQA